jgi:hypothetical protein
LEELFCLGLDESESDESLLYDENDINNSPETVRSEITISTESEKLQAHQFILMTLPLQTKVDIHNILVFIPYYFKFYYY